MSGIYIHIPFCKQACHYCNFHFSTSLKYKDLLIESILKELEMRRNYLTDKKISSIYFGGGTPSLLSRSELESILNKLATIYTWGLDCEITLEANPDDITKTYLKDLNLVGINRLSVGIQSFQERDLQFMNRAHTSSESHAVLDVIDQSDIKEVSVDIIFGTPELSDDELESNLQLVLSHRINHMSCYALTVEEGTALQHFIKTKKIEDLNDDQSARQFTLIQNMLRHNSFEQYEVSNYAKNQIYAVHNTNYWKSVPYLGIGPSAHSFDGQHRSWNIANNQIYMNCIRDGQSYSEVETLDLSEKYNEYIMTRLRTKWGIPVVELQTSFHKFYDYFIKLSKPFLEKQWMIFENSDSYKLTSQGMLYADHIASVLFYISDENEL